MDLSSRPQPGYLSAHSASDKAERSSHIQVALRGSSCCGLCSPPHRPGPFAADTPPHLSQKVFFPHYRVTDSHRRTTSPAAIALRPNTAPRKKSIRGPGFHTNSFRPFREQKSRKVTESEFRSRISKRPEFRVRFQEFQEFPGISRNSGFPGGQFPALLCLFPSSRSKFPPEGGVPYGIIPGATLRFWCVNACQ